MRAKVAERKPLPQPEFLAPLTRKGTPYSEKKGRIPAVKPTAKQKENLFVKYYNGVCNGNGTQAAIKAGYSKRSASVIASRLLARDNVKETVELQRQTAAEKLGITHEWILSQYKDVAALPAMPGGVLKLQALEQLAKHVGLEGIGVVKTDSKSVVTGPVPIVQISFVDVDLRKDDPDYAAQRSIEA